MAQLSGQASLPIYPSGPSEFFYKDVKAQISFQLDPAGQASALILHQNGADIRMARLDDATARQKREALAARIKDPKPTPGAEPALRHLIDGLLNNMPDYGAMTPILSDAIRQNQDKVTAFLGKLGSVQSVQFVAINDQGADVYSVRHENGASHWSIALDQQGLLAIAFMAPGP